MNREDAEGNNLFEGGFLGLDNIGPIDRSHLPVGGTLEQSDATGWMAFYAMAMAGIAIVLNWTGQRPEYDLILKFLAHFAAISDAIDSQGLWDEQDGLYYDRLNTPDGGAVPVKVRSMVGIIPMLAAAVADEQMLDRALMISRQFADYAQRRGLHDREKLQETGLMRGEPGSQRLLLSVVGIDRLEKLFTKMFDESEFLSPYGLRALSAYHRDHPYDAGRGGVQRHHRLRARRVDHGHVRRELQLARAAVVPAQLPDLRLAWSATPGSSATTSRSSTRPGPGSASRWPTSSPTCSPGSSRSS